MQIHTVLAYPMLNRLEKKNYPLLRLPGHLSRQNLITASVLGCSLSFLEEERISRGTRSADNPHIYSEGSFPSLLNHEQLWRREFSPWCLFHCVCIPVYNVFWFGRGWKVLRFKYSFFVIDLYGCTESSLYTKSHPWIQWKTLLWGFSEASSGAVQFTRTLLPRD